MRPDLPKPATYAHNGKERFSPPIDSSILTVTTSLPQVTGLLFLRLVSEACQMSSSARVFLTIFCVQWASF